VLTRIRAISHHELSCASHVFGTGKPLKITANGNYCGSNVFYFLYSYHDKPQPVVEHKLRVMQNLIQYGEWTVLVFLSDIQSICYRLCNKKYFINILMIFVLLVMLHSNITDAF